ncbi:TPA: hypothetical protein TYI97_000527 [Streptococcus suis]|nr:hypothetical protein [Streptococcus suis]
MEKAIYEDNGKSNLRRQWKKQSTKTMEKAIYEDNGKSNLRRQWKKQSTKTMEKAPAGKNFLRGRQ